MRLSWVWISLAALGWASGANAQQARSEITPSIFLQQPDGRDFVENYPEAAAAQSVIGYATVECVVELDTTTTCEVTAEAPTNWGFGQAALNISRSFRVAPAEIDGVPTRGGRVRRTIRFTLPPDGAQKNWTPEQRAFYDANRAPDLPSWDEAPNFDAVQSVYPAASRAAQINGRGVLSCNVRRDRRLNCELSREMPDDQGFGAAALQLAPHFRVAESDAGFISRYRRTPFGLPIYFSAEPTESPVGRFLTGLTPMRTPMLYPPLDVYPAAARAAGVQGSVIALCTLNQTPPATCVIEQENPTGYGLGDFILETLGQLPASGSDVGFVVGDQIRLEFQFNLP